MTKILAPGGFGRRELQVGITHEVVEERGITATLRGEMRVLVKTLATVREMRDECINEHVARARGDHRWLANLKRRCRWRTEIRNGAPLMKDGLAMAPNERNSFSRNLELAARGQGGVSE